MRDEVAKESAYITDKDRYMTITKFAWDEKINHIKFLMEQNCKLIEGLKAIEVKLSYLPNDESAKEVVMKMIDELFDSLPKREWEATV